MNILKILLLLYPTLLFSALLPSADDSLQLSNAINTACASNDTRSIHLGHGNFYFKTPLPPIPCSINIIGDGIGSTYLIREYDGGTFLYWKRGVDHSGGSIRYLSIGAGKNTNNGIAILVEAESDTDNQVNSYNRHTFTIDHISIGRISANNTSWSHGIYLDGSRNPDNFNGIAAGVRMTQISNTTISGTNVSQIYLNKARGPNLLNVDCFIPLNGSLNGVFIDNNTQGVKLDSRTCQYKFIDNESNWLVYNAVRIK